MSAVVVKRSKPAAGGQEPGESPDRIWAGSRLSFIASSQDFQCLRPEDLPAKEIHSAGNAGPPCGILDVRNGSEAQVWQTSKLS